MHHPRARTGLRRCPPSPLRDSRARWPARAATALACAAWLALAPAAAVRAEVPAGDRPTGPITERGQKEPRAWVLPNGRLIHPLGKQVKVGGLPLNAVATPDGRFLVVANCGAGRQSLTVLDAHTLEQTDDREVKCIFHGLAVSKDGGTVWACGGGGDNVLRFRLENGKLADDGAAKCAGYPTSCALSPDGKRLYVTCNLARCMRVLDTTDMAEVQRIETGSMPFGVALTPDGDRAFVSNWADGTVTVVDLAGDRPVRTLPAGGLPCAVAVAPGGKRVYVANANTDNLTVIDAADGQVVGAIALHPYPNSPNGASPNALAFGRDGKTLYVALAGINAIGVVTLPDGRLSGMLPTAWYPTCLVPAESGAALLVVNAKGVGSGPNKSGGHVSQMMRGTVQRLDVGDEAALRRATTDVWTLNGFGSRRTAAQAPAAGELPTGIQHVVLIVRESRTFDQVLGDLAGAKGDPELAQFGEAVTPNLHALAQRFAVANNMYADGEVSAQGHQWTLGANCSDYVEKTWPALTAGRGREIDAAPGPVTYPAIGYLMDACVRRGLSCRMYGDIVRRGRDGKPIQAMEGKVAPGYAPFNLDVPDVERVHAWQNELGKGIFPQFTYIWLPNDHTAGSKPGAISPRSMIADNDLATGLIVDALSRRPEWRETVVFIVEDDTQDGRDHVDAHRDVLLVASPWVREGAVSGHHYSIPSIHATIERLLGLPPMSQYDDLADPVAGIWNERPDLRPFRFVVNRVPIDERNPEQRP